LFAIPVVTLIYIMIQFVCIGTFSELANSGSPLADAASRFLGSAGFPIVTLGAMISIAGSLNGNILGSPRLLFAMSEQHQLPAFLSFTHKKFKTPYVAILISSTVILVFTISNTFMSALLISTFMRLIIYAATSVSLLVFRNKKNLEQPMFKAPYGIVISIISLVSVGWLLSNTTWTEMRAVCIMAVVGLMIYFVFKFSQRTTQLKRSADLSNKILVGN
jgi:amino acid transporter